MSDLKKHPQGKGTGSFRKMTRKKWFYPAVYLCLAAIVMSGVLWYQFSGTTNQSASKHSKQSVSFVKNQKAAPVNATQEVFKWPVGNKNAVDIIQPFYNAKGTTQQQVAALVNYDNSYSQNTGINLQAKDKKPFEVRAAMSGKVVSAKKDPVLGYVVELQHKNGVTTVYQSLSSTHVKAGQVVAQGALLGKAGANKFNKAAGVHLHFEIQKNSFPVDPVSYFSKDLSTLKNVKASGTADQSVAADATGTTAKK